MKITAEFKDGIAKTSIPCISYDMSAKEYDANLLALASAVLAACAENIGNGDNETSMMALNAITECAKMFIEQECEN